MLLLGCCRFFEATAIGRRDGFGNTSRLSRRAAG